MTLQEITDALAALVTELGTLLAAEKPTEEQASKAEELSAKIKVLEIRKIALVNLEAIKVEQRARTIANTAVAAQGLPIVNVADVRVGMSSVERAGKLPQALTGLWLGGAFRGNVDQRKQYIELSGETEFRTQIMGSDSLGGFLVPNEVSAYIIDLQNQFGVFRANSRGETMSSETKSVPRFDQDVTAYWGIEAGTLTASDMKAGMINLLARKMYALGIITEELDMNSAIDLGVRFGTSSARQFAKKEDQAGFVGDATSTHGGITGVTTKLTGLSVTIANIAGLKVAAGNLFSEFVMGDFIATKNLLPDYAHANAAWYFNRVTWGETAERLALAVGGVTALEVTGALGERFLGYPVKFVDALPKADVNSQIAVLFGDLSLASTFGDRKAITIATDTSVGFLTGLVYVKATQYLDINVHDVGNASATPSARQAGPIVGIISAAA